MSKDIKKYSDFKSAKIWIMFLFYVLSLFKRGDTIQGGTLLKGGRYLRKYGRKNSAKQNHFAILLSLQKYSLDHDQGSRASSQKYHVKVV